MTVEFCQLILYPSIFLNSIIGYSSIFHWFSWVFQIYNISIIITLRNSTILFCIFPLTQESLIESFENLLIICGLIACFGQKSLVYYFYFPKLTEVFCFNICSVFVNDPNAFEKKVYSLLLGYRVKYMAIYEPPDWFFSVLYILNNF